MKYPTAKHSRCEVPPPVPCTSIAIEQLLSVALSPSGLLNISWAGLLRKVRTKNMSSQCMICPKDRDHLHPLAEVDA